MSKLPSSPDQFPSSTAQWCLVVHRVTPSSAEIWVGTLFPTLKKPDLARVQLVETGSDQVVAEKLIKKAQWKRPFRHVDQRFFYLCLFEDLNANIRYEAKFERQIRFENDAGEVQQAWQPLRRGLFSTLPKKLPAKGKKPFTVSLNSCYYHHRDGGQAAAAFKALYERGDDSVRPDISFLTGDQVYLDIGFDSLSLIDAEIRERIASDYALHWQALGSILSRGGTWMLPDDHEYWNDYPNYKTAIPTLQALRIDSVRKAWTDAAKDGVKNIQRSPRLETFQIGSSLSFCLADLRSYRTANLFAPGPIFSQLTDWASSLTTPGVLVLPQPLIVEENPNEKNLLSYRQQYSQLLQSLAASGHDIVLLSGDVHFGRIGSVPLGNNGGRLVEVIASPLSNLTGLNGIATAKPKLKPKTFPDPKVIEVDGLTPQPVSYDKAFTVSTHKRDLFGGYPRARTREHFMTVGFCRLKKGGVEMSVDAWRVRTTDAAGSPTPDFKQAYRIKLK